MKKIDEELRQQRKKIWIEQIKQSKFSIGLVLVIVVILSWNIYKSSDRLVESQSIYGTLIGIHQVQTNLGSSARMLSVELENGERVIVAAPENFVAENQAEVELSKGESAQGSVYYYFVGYRQ